MQLYIFSVSIDLNSGRDDSVFGACPDHVTIGHVASVTRVKCDLDAVDIHQLQYLELNKTNKFDLKGLQKEQKVTSNKARIIKRKT